MHIFIFFLGRGFPKKESCRKGEIMKKNTMITMLFIIGLIPCLIQVSGGNAWADSSEQTQEVVIQPSGIYTPVWEPIPPVFTEEQKARLESMIGRTHLSGPPTPQVGVPLGPVPGTETVPSKSQAPGTLVLRRNADLTSIVPSTFASHVLEPAVANEGMFVFYTANWFAARSTSGGAGGTWSYINPFADFANFCCDQDVTYDPARRLLIWYRQGVADVNGNNVFKLGVSIDGGGTFCTYTVAPTDINAAWTNQWWDYPHLGLSNDYLYIASNVFNASNTWTRTVMLRVPLDGISTCAAVTVDSYSVTNLFNFTPVAGVKTAMFFASHINTSSMRIYKWPENSTSVTTTDKTIDAWTSTPRGSAVCTTGDGHNPCARTDDRILSGWTTGCSGFPGESCIGFFWNVKQDAVNFLMPYVNSAVFKISDLTYIARPYIYASNTAYIYASGSPNARNNVGVSFFGVPSSGFPTHMVAVDDDYNPAPPPWTSTLVTNTSTAGPADNVWGDYVRVRPHNPAGLQWIATGYSIPASTANNSNPRYIIFGRERDNKSLNRWILN
jgi:hypothetical protein